jgi:hypothetical protein
MPEPDNDKLEKFFQKAASRPDIVFDENDWKKLEARLDAKTPPVSVAKNATTKIATVVVIITLFLGGTIYWNNANRPDVLKTSPEVKSDKKDAANRANKDNVFAETNTPAGLNDQGDIQNAPVQPGKDVANNLASSTIEDISASKGKPNEFPVARDKPAVNAQTIKEDGQTPGQITDTQHTTLAFTSQVSESGNHPIHSGVAQISRNKIHNDLIKLSPAAAEKIKQKAGVVLPGAEEENSREVETIVKEEYGSGQTEHLVSPRLSLLLSLAPDFSTTKLNEYSSPGGAFGLMIHYHLLNSWSISAGALKNNKKYTGEGDDYQPPKGYWKYYTNGITPETIDGACNILEIPVMVQYTIGDIGRSRFLVGAGASSYVMLNESYHYNFDQPNPGAKEGWDSKKTSRFLFNMVNFTIGFEHQIGPGFMIGIEPYVKIPVAAIGWSNLKLYSTGASFTLRYILLKKQNASLTTRNRGPD